MAGVATGVLLQGFTAPEIAHLAAERTAAVATSRARIGTGVVGVFGRSPTVMSLSALSLAQLADGRALLGLGVQARSRSR